MILFSCRLVEARSGSALRRQCENYGKESAQFDVLGAKNLRLKER